VCKLFDVARVEEADTGRGLLCREAAASFPLPDRFRAYVEQAGDLRCQEKFSIHALSLRAAISRR
jgi:hypothetical protein